MDELSDGEAVGVTDLPVSGVVVGEGGTTQGPAGLPLKFPRTRDGAVAAATVYLVTLSSSGMYQPATANQVLRSIGSPNWLAKAQGPAVAAIAAEGRKLGLNAAGQPPKDSVILVNVRPSWGAFRVAEFDSSSAEVVIWNEMERGVVKRSGTTPESQWRLSTVGLTWVSDDWKLAALPTHEPGPVPSSSAEVPPAPSERARLLGSAWSLYSGPER